MPINSLDRFSPARVGIAMIVLCLLHACNDSSDGDALQSGSRYKLIRPVYLMGVYEDGENKQLDKENARAYLEPKKLAHRYYTAFQCEVPVGTFMTIVASTPKIWPLPFFSKRYIVKLDPDLSRGLDVVLELDRGMEGNLDGLNPELFRREKLR